MNFATLEEICQQLQLDTEDLEPSLESLLTNYSQAAIRTIEVELNCTLYEKESDIPDTETKGIVFFFFLKIAQLLIVADWYQNREDTSRAYLYQIPFSAHNMLIKQRRFNV